MMERESGAMNPSLRNRGFRTTQTCRTFGATDAASKLLGLKEEQFASSLGFGRAGLRSQEMHGPSMGERFNPGLTARNGTTAACMAQFVLTGADTIFDRGAAS